MRTDRTTLTKWARWVGTFVGFPLAGVAARLAVGDVDGTGPAVVGGVVAGAVLGLVQVTVGGLDRSRRWHWVAASAAGFGVGLGLGANVVGFDTDAASLVAMGAISGAGVGFAQAIALPMRLTDRVFWAVSTPALWSLGWLITSQVIVDADRQHAGFGSSGALVVSALAGLLHIARRPVRIATGASRPASLSAAVAR